MPNNVIVLDPPSPDASINRDMINAKILAAAISGDWVTGSGTYEIANLPSDYRYIKLQAGTRLFGPKTPGGLTFKFLPIGGGIPAGSSIGMFWVDSEPAPGAIEDMTIICPGEEMTQAIRHGYSGPIERTVTLNRLVVTGAKYAFKSQGGRTNVRIIDCDFKAWGTTTLCTHALNADGSVPLDKIGARIEILGGKFEAYQLEGHEADTEHCWYINPTFQAYVGGSLANGNQKLSYQCNGPELVGHGGAKLVDVTINDRCEAGVQTHPTAQMQIIRPRFAPRGTCITMRSGGLYMQNGYMKPAGVVLDGVVVGPLGVVIDNEIVDYNGVLFENITIEADPTVGFFYRLKPGPLPWVLNNVAITQRNASTLPSIVYFQKVADIPPPTDAVFEFIKGHITMTKGRLWGWSLCPGGTIVVDQLSVYRGPLVADSVPPADANIPIL